MMKFDQAPIYSVRCFVHPFQNLYHLSHVYSGLLAVAKDGAARVTLELSQRNDDHALDPYALFAEVVDSRAGDGRKTVFDMYDASNVFAMNALERCDVYFKRSYHPPDLGPLSAKSKAKVVPFGINYSCQTPEATLRLLSALLPDWTLRVFKSPLKTLRGLDGAGVPAFLTSPHVSRFEQPPDRPLRRSVHFENRVWERQAGMPDSLESVNRMRVEISRLLKKEFGASFHGGIVQTKYASRYCPTDLSPHSRTRRSYIARSKQMLIGVYTRGLHHSTAFKLGEYLAGSKCIVAEPIRNQLPTPLVAGRNYLEFSSPRECVERCIQILKDEELANQMRRDNWEYYQREVRPDRHVANCLERAFGRTATSRTTATAPQADGAIPTADQMPLQSVSRGTP
jgi:hypothetical protein